MRHRVPDHVVARPATTASASGCVASASGRVGEAHDCARTSRTRSPRVVRARCVLFDWTTGAWSTRARTDEADIEAAVRTCLRYSGCGVEERAGDMRTRIYRERVRRHRTEDADVMIGAGRSDDASRRDFQWRQRERGRVNSAYRNATNLSRP
jgi:hypothetical protein